ncbi:MAG: ribosome silencing factor [Spirochaetales bacterium]|nr:ribosome silencing factor [Spirochaetales bacterium]
MEPTVKDNTLVLDIGNLIDEHKGKETIVLYVGDMCSWTDYFVITTVRSDAHLKGLLRSLSEYFDANNIVPINARKNINEKGWVLIDCGNFVIHLMESEQREFYELERLWFKGEVIFHSSRSS